MSTFLGLVGLVLFICGVIGLAAGITYLVVKLFPPKNKKKKPPAPEPDPVPAE